MTAEELMRQLESDPVWVADRKRRDERFAEVAQKRRDDQQSLISELANAGIGVESVYDLVKNHQTPLAAIPILVRHLDVMYDSVIRSGIIRSLGFTEARSRAFEPLCRRFKSEREPSIQFDIANALSGMARFEDVSHLPGMDRFQSLFDDSR